MLSPTSITQIQLTSPLSRNLQTTRPLQGGEFTLRNSTYCLTHALSQCRYQTTPSPSLERPPGAYLEDVTRVVAETETPLTRVYIADVIKSELGLYCAFQSRVVFLACREAATSGGGKSCPLYRRKYTLCFSMTTPPVNFCMVTSKLVITTDELGKDYEPDSAKKA